MKTLWCLTLILAAPLAGCGPLDDDEKGTGELNVNSRYTVESVHVNGGSSFRLPEPLRILLNSFVGEKFDRSALDKVADRLRADLHVTDVKINVTRGSDPEHVSVEFQVKPQTFDLLMGRSLYASREGWSGEGGATVNVHGNAITFGLLSDGDSMIERYAGIRAKFERKNVGTDRLRLRFEFESYHDQWNLATLDAAQPGEIYRTRQIFSPMATVVIFQPLELDFGVSFARLRVPFSVPNQTEGGGAAAAKTDSSNAVVSTLRYHQRWGSEHDQKQQEVNASYGVEAGSNLLDTDQVFTRHLLRGRYKLRHARNSLEVGFLAGVIHGNAPLYERFALGDSTTLRGWNKFDLDPLGGSHVIHGSIDYAYRFLQMFYDTGAIWDRVQEKEPKQSAGVGFKKECFQLAVAFPLRYGRATPIFYAGMNF
jgi:outer membrane protein assembly factor BamA